MLTLCGNEDNQTTCFLFVGANSSSNKSGGLITSNTSLICSSNNDCMDTCSFYSGPSDSTIQSVGSAYYENDYTGTVASSGGYTGVFGVSGSGESCGSLATTGGCSSFSSGSSSFSCSYSC